MAIKSVSRFLIPFALSLGAWSQSGIAWEYLPINSQQGNIVRSGLWLTTTTTSPFPVDLVLVVDGKTQTFHVVLDPNRTGQALLPVPSEIMSRLMDYGSHRAEIRSLSVGGTAVNEPVAQVWYGSNE